MAIGGCVVREVIESDLWYFKTTVSATCIYLAWALIPVDTGRHLYRVAFKVCAGDGVDARITAAAVGSCVLSSTKCSGI